MNKEQKDQFRAELYNLLARFGNAIGIKTHSIYECEYEGDTPPDGCEVYESIQAACMAMDNYASEED